MTKTTVRPAFPFKSLALLIIFAFLLTSCAPAATPIPPTATPAPTDTPQPPATSTPLPSATATATITPTATATATATATITPNVTATQEAALTSTAEARLAVIQPDLETYGVKPEDGSLLWYSEDPIELSVNQYGQGIFYPLEDVDQVSDFLFQSDVEWNSSSGLAGCGLLYRSERNISDGEQYAFLLMRLQYNPIWEVNYRNFGRFQSVIANPNTALKAATIKDDKNSVNRIALLAQGKQFTVFINGEKIATGDASKRLKGFAALLVYQESGDSTCVFKNNWMWVPKQ